MTDGARREKSDLPAIFAARALWRESDLRSHPARGAVRWAERVLFKGGGLYPGTPGLIDSLIEGAGRHVRPGGNSFFPAFCILLLEAKRRGDCDLETLEQIREQIAEMEEVLPQTDDAAPTVLPAEPEEPRENTPTTRKDRFEQLLKDAGRHPQECPHDSARSLASCLVGKGVCGFSVDTASRILRGTYGPAERLGFERFPGLDL